MTRGRPRNKDRLPNPIPDLPLPDLFPFLRDHILRPFYMHPVVAAMYRMNLRSQQAWGDLLGRNLGRHFAMPAIQVDATMSPDLAHLKRRWGLRHRGSKQLMKPIQGLEMVLVILRLWDQLGALDSPEHDPNPQARQLFDTPIMDAVREWVDVATDTTAPARGTGRRLSFLAIQEAWQPAPPDLDLVEEWCTTYQEMCGGAWGVLKQMLYDRGFRRQWNYFPHLAYLDWHGIPRAIIARGTGLSPPMLSIWRTQWTLQRWPGEADEEKLMALVERVEFEYSVMIRRLTRPQRRHLAETFEPVAHVLKQHCTWREGVTWALD
jgi:hypothetical protein